MAIGRLFTELGLKSTLPADLQASLTAIQDLGYKTNAATKSMISSFNDTLNPTDKLGEQITALTMAGKTDAEMWTVLGEKVKSAMDQAGKTGQTIDPAVAALANFGKGAEESTGQLEALGKIITDVAENPLKAIQTGITSFLETLGPTAVGIGAMATAAIAAGVGLYEFVGNAAAAQEQLDNLSAITGMSVQDLQALKEIAKEAGLQSLDLGNVISRLNKELGSDSTGQFEKGLKQLGVSVNDANGNQKDMITLLDEVGAKLRAIPTDAERTAQANAVLGARYKELIPLLLLSTKSLHDQMEEFKNAGIGTDDLTQNRLRAFHEMQNQVEKQTLILKNEIIALAASLGEILIPAIEKAVTAFAWIVEGLLKFGKAAGDQISKVLELAGAIETVESQYKKWVSQLDPAVLQRQAAAVGVTIAEYEKLIESSKNAGLIFGQNREALNKLNEQEKTGIITHGEHLVALQKLLNPFQANSAAVNKLKEEQEKLSAEWKKAIAPLSSISSEFVKMKAIGADINTFVALHEAAIIAAAKKQEELGQALSDADVQLLAQALELQHAKIAADNMLTAVDPLVTQQQNFAKACEASAEALNVKLTAELNKATEALDKYLDAAKPRDPLKKIIPTDAEFKKITGSFDTLKTHIKSVGTQMSEAFAGGFDRLTADLAKSIVDWKGWGDALKSFWKTLAADFLNIMLNNILAPLKQVFANIGKALGNAISGATGTTGTASAGILAGTSGRSLLTSLATAGTGMGLGALVSAASTSGSITGQVSTMAASVGGSLGMLALLNPTAFTALLGTGPAGWMVLAGLGAVAAVGPLVKVFTGKNAWQAGAPEAMRDFGVSLSTSQFQSWAEALGLTESKTYPIRKELESSPAFLSAFANQVDTSKLSAVSYTNTAGQYATVDMSAAFATGKATGDWTALNKIWMETMGTSSALAANMPDFASKLLGVEKATEAVTDATTDAVDATEEATTATTAATAAVHTLSLAEQSQLVVLQAQIDAYDAQITSLTAFRSTLAGTTSDMYTQFTESGTITDELAQKITDLGGNLADFQNYARLKDLGATFTDLTTTFKENYTITDDLSSIYQEFGGDMAVLNAAAQLPALTASIDTLTAFRDAVQATLPATQTMYEKFLSTGEITDELSAQIQNFGLNLAHFTTYSNLLTVSNTFDDLVQHFTDTGEILPQLRVLFQQFGGDLSALNAVAQLPNLAASLTQITDLYTGLETLIPTEETALQKFLKTGMITDEFHSTLSSFLNTDQMSLMTQLSQMITWKENLATELDNYTKTGTVSEYLQSVIRANLPSLSPDWSVNIDTFKTWLTSSIGTLASQLLPQLKTASDAITSQTSTIQSNLETQFTTVANNIASAFSDSKTTIVADLNAIITTLTTQYSTTMTDLNTQFTNVGTAISDAFDTAKTTVLADIDSMIMRLNFLKTTAQDAINAINNRTISRTEPYYSDRSSSETDRSGTPATDQIERPDSTRNGGGVNVGITIEGPVYGLDDLDKKLSESITRTLRRGGLRILTAGR